MSNISGGQQTNFPEEQTAELFAGSTPDLGIPSGESYVNEEDSAELPFGRMLIQGDADRGAKLMSEQGDTLIGVLLRSQAYNKRHELGEDGLKPKATCSVLPRGKVWVKVEDEVNLGDKVRVHKDGGKFQTGSSAGDTVDISANARWRTSAGAGELALVEYDMAGMNENKSSD